MFLTQTTRFLAIILLIGFIGCHRSHYRQQADADARRLIQQKASDPRWDSADGSIEVDPQSRMFNPFSEDHPPLPPDDPTSHTLMHQVDCKPGYPCWHQAGDTPDVENRNWASYLSVDDQGRAILNLERAYQLALLHSPQLQQQKETLYLSALDVSLERFGFDTQIFSGFNSFFTSQGRFRGSSGSSTDLSGGLGANNDGINFRRLGISGTNFAVGLANTILFNFTGSNTQSTSTLIDFSIIQPLLRGAGQERIMESLTQSERTLLANVRQLERFRRGFFLQIAMGRNPGTGPNRSGNFLSTPSSANSNPGGFFGLLLQQQQIRNQEFNVRQLGAVLEQFREFFLRQRLDAVQLKLFESNVYSQQSSLVEAKIRYQTAVDRFKQTLGLPPHLEIIIKDSFLDQFELVSEQINERMIAVDRLRKQTGDTLNQIDNLLPGTQLETKQDNFAWDEKISLRINELIPHIQSAIRLLSEVSQQDLVQLKSDIQKLDQVRNSRLAYLKKLTQAIESGEIVSDVDPSLYQSDSIPTANDLNLILSGLENNLSVTSRITSLETQLEQTESLLQQLIEDKDRPQGPALFQLIVEDFQKTIPGQLSELNNILLEMSLLQARARSNSIQIEAVDIDAESATEVARCLRRDWMNARASLVDRWRRIEFVADQLESQLDLVFQGDIGNVGDNPLKLRYETGQLRVGFRFDAPTVRLAERNAYRETLINYQQARRTYYQFEDEVSRNLRETIRNINRNQVLFELNRRSVQVQIEQIELNRFSLVDPEATSLGTSTARNLTDAIIGLNRIQNSFLQTWVEYEVLRRNLDFDMGTMQLDASGIWLDPGSFGETTRFTEDLNLNPVTF